MKKLAFIILALFSITVYAQDFHDGKFSTTGKSITGVWVESPEVATDYGQMKLVLYSISNKHYIALLGNDGYIVNPLTKKVIENTNRYYDTNSSFGEYYVVTNQGLKVYDSQGYIATHKKSSL